MTQLILYEYNSKYPNSKPAKNIPFDWFIYTFLSRKIRKIFRLLKKIDAMIVERLEAQCQS